MERKPRDNLDDIILSIFQEDNQLFFPITSDGDARTFTMLLQHKGIDTNRLSQELNEAEVGVSHCMQTGLMKSAVWRKAVQRINQPLTDFLLFESELEYADSFIHVEELRIEGFNDSELVCNGANSFGASSVNGEERGVVRPRRLLRAIKKRRCKRIPITGTNGENEGQSKNGHGVGTGHWEHDPSDQGASLDEGDYSLIDSERTLKIASLDEGDYCLVDSESALNVASGMRAGDYCALTQQTDDGLEMSEATLDHADGNGLDASQPDWDDICDRFLLADENSLYEDIQSEPRATDQGLESAGSLTDVENPPEDNETTMGGFVNTPHLVYHDTPATLSSTNERNEILEGTGQLSCDFASDGFELSFNVDGRSMGDLEAFEDDIQKDNVQSPNTLIEKSVFETQEDGFGFKTKVGEVREFSSSDGCNTSENQDFLQDDGLLIVLTTTRDEELNKGEADEDSNKVVQTEMDLIPSTVTVTEGSDSTPGSIANSGTDVVDTLERESLTDSSTFDLKSQTIVKLSEAEMTNGGYSLKCVSVSEKCSGHLGNTLSSKAAVCEEISSSYKTERFSDFENATHEITSANVKHSNDTSTGDASAGSDKVEFLVSASTVASDTKDSLSLLPRTETVELFKIVNEDPIDFADSSPIGGSMLLEDESDSSIKDATDVEQQTNPMSLLSPTSEPFSASSLFQETELFPEHLEGKPFAETSLLEELEQLTTFSLFGRSKHTDEAGIGKADIQGDMDLEIQSQYYANADPGNDGKASAISAPLSSEEKSQEVPGYIYVFTDGCNSSKVQRFKVGSVICPYEELQRAKMFNVDIKLVSATAHSSPDRVFQQIKSKLEEWKMEGKEDWYLCPSNVILQTITEVVNTHL